MDPINFGLKFWAPNKTLGLKNVWTNVTVTAETWIYDRYPEGIGRHNVKMSVCLSFCHVTFSKMSAPEIYIRRPYMSLSAIFGQMSLNPTFKVWSKLDQ